MDLARHALNILLWYSVNFYLVKLIVRQMSIVFIAKIIDVIISSETYVRSDKSMTAVEKGQPNICWTSLVKCPSDFGEFVGTSRPYIGIFSMRGCL